MPQATIIIVTRNRKEKLKKALDSAIAQAGDHEILVVDDASEDGTVEFVRTEFSQVGVLGSERQVGLIVQRNRAAREANGRVMVNLDDDALFVDANVVNDTLAIFDASPRVGVVTIPYINCLPDGSESVVGNIAPADERIYVVSAFPGGSSAVRRDVFERLGGLCGDFFQWGEETEFSQRLMGAGYVIAANRRIGVRHYPLASSKYTRKVNRYIFRNRILTVWRNAPTLYLPLLLSYQTCSALAACRHGLSDARTAMEGMTMAYGAMLRGWRQRKPIRLSRFRAWMKLRKNPLTPLDQLEPKLGPLPE
jgi:GT2 family glycosyltransferase